MLDGPRSWVEAYASGLGAPMSVPVACQACVARVNVRGSGITLVGTTGAGEGMFATDRLAAGLQELELALGEGPNLTSHQSDQLVLIPDLAEPRARERWPIFAPAAMDAGVAAVFVFPVRIGAIRLGTLMLHDTTSRSLSLQQLTDATAFVELLLPLLLNERRPVPGRFAAMDDANSHYAEVHQATGMISVQLGVDLEEAFVRLRARAFSEGRRLPDLARDVVERRVRFSPDDEPDPEPLRGAP